jgi:eukaryotic-like serine/threonine-protein kinase
MSGSAGERLGPYELVSRIGAGGMGEVWRAKDTRLDRAVAVKILPAEFAGNAQLRMRFEREARTISQLDHPNICALYDVGENYLVMELLEGETLADRIARGPLPLTDVTRFGAQLADALDRAHRAGVVHRDVKPGNVVITRTGAKLLDFGLAKSAQIESAADDATQHKPLTREGTIVGTFQYMAPEQLEGAEADARTDIFALGAVLYEMTTGRRAFEGKTRTSLIAAIVAGNPPPVSELQPLTPPALEHLIAKCLSKERDDRWQSAHDVAEELRWIGNQGSRAGVAAQAPGTRRWRERLLWIAALLAAIAIAAWLALRPQPKLPVLQASIVFENNGGLEYLSGPPAVSPDGKWLVYAARDSDGVLKLWLQSLAGGPARAIEGTAGASAPFWSPDSQFIAFADSSATLRKVAAGGGHIETLATRTTGGSAWNRDGVILYNVGWQDNVVRRINASGGESSEVLKTSDIGAQFIVYPTFLPDDNHYLFFATGGSLRQRGQEGVWVGTLDEREPPRFLIQTDTYARYVATGHLLFVRDGSLRAQRFDPKTLTLSGEATVIAPIQTFQTHGVFSASDDGLLVYQPPGMAPKSELVLKNRKGERIGSFGEPAFYWGPRFSPDGTRVLVDRSDDRAIGDIWVLSREGGNRVTFDASNETTAVWSPSGEEIIYSRDTAPQGIVLLRQRIGGTPSEVLRHGTSGPNDWSPDGRHLAVDRITAGTTSDLAVWSLEERKWIDVAATPAGEAKGSFSPDGKWLTYQSDESGRYEIYVQPFPPDGTKHQVSTNGGVTPRWAREGEIVWVDLANQLNAVKVATSPPFRTGTPETLFPVQQQHLFFHEFDAGPDGTFVVNERVRTAPKPLTLLVNWQQRLAQ